MSEQYKNAVCRGSWALGTACGKCERCIETNPHKSNPMSEQSRVAFEKWYARNFLEHIPTHDKPAYFVKFGIGYSSPHVDGVWHGWQAAISYMQEQGKLAEQSEPVENKEAISNLWESIGRWSAYLASNGEKAELSPPSWLIDAVNNATTPQRQQPLKRLNDEQLDECWDKGKGKFTDIANKIMNEMERINK